METLQFDHDLLTVSMLKLHRLSELSHGTDARALGRNVESGCPQLGGRERQQI